MTTKLSWDFTKILLPIIFATFTFLSCWDADPVSSTPTYTLTYTGNDSTNGNVPIDSNRYEALDIVTVLENLHALEKKGYTFIGWNTASDGSGTTYLPGATFTMGAADVILYAQWSKDSVYKVIYNGNGSDGGVVPVDSLLYLKNDTVTVVGNIGSLTKTGFTFIGWSTTIDGEIIGTTFIIGEYDVTLYAQWSSNPTFKVIYNGNENTGGIVPKDSVNYKAGDTVTVLANDGALIKDGYLFDGWNTKIDGSGIIYPVGATFLMSNSNITLFAQWVLESIDSVKLLNEKMISPSATKVIAGKEFEMSVSASGKEPVLFTWLKDDVLIDEANNDTLSFLNLSSTDVGTYKCIATNEYNSDTSNGYILTVYTPPIINNNKAILVSTNTPQIGKTIKLSIDATGSDTLKYQWYHNTLLLTGEVNDTLIMLSPQEANAGEYKCIVVNEYGSDTSVTYNLDFNNTPPEATDTSIIVEETIETAINISATDVDGDALTWRILNLPENGITNKSNGSIIDSSEFTFTSGNFLSNKNDEIQIEVSDGTSTCSLVVSLIINADNDSPSFTGGATVNVPQDTGAVVFPGWATEMSSGDDTAQVLTFYVSETSVPAGLFTAIPVINSNGDLSFSTTDNAFGTAIYRVILKDGGSGNDSSQVATLTINVTEVNKKPIFNLPTVPSTNVIVDEKQVQNVAFLVSDPDGTTPIFDVLAAPDWVTVVDNGGGSYNLKIAPSDTVSSQSNNFNTAVTIKLIDSNDANLFNVHTVNINVNNINNPPVFNDPKPVSEDVQIGTIYIATISAKDDDNDEVTISLVEKPDGMSFNASTGEISWNVDRGLFNVESGPLTIIVEAEDGKDTTRYEWTLTLTPHEWSYVSDHSAYRILAKDSLIVFKMKDRYLYSSEDGGLNFNNSFDMNIDPRNSHFVVGAEICENKLYIGKTNNFPGLSSTSMTTLDISSGTITEEANSYYALTMGYLLGFNRHASENKPYLIAFDFSSTTVQSIFPDSTFKTLQNVNISDNKPIAIAFSKNAISNVGFVICGAGLYQYNQYGTMWYNVNSALKFNENSKIAIVGQLADSLFVTDTLNKLQFNSHADDDILDFSDITPTELNGVKDIQMINSTTGWIISTDDELYYTNDCFQSISKEVVKDENGINCDVRKIIIAEDSKSVFLDAYSTKSILLKY